MPLFSIVTVCLNDLQNLLKTSASVAKQKFTDREYIICDGGSSNSTKNHLPQLGADRYISEPDNGIFDAMNRALKLCTGEFIYFLNAGDTFYSPSVLAQVADLIHNNNSTPFFYGDVYYPSSKRPFSIQPERLTSFTLFRGTVCHQAWFLSAEIYRELGGFDTNLKYQGDYDVVNRIVHELHVPYLHIPICIVYYKGGGFSKKNINNGRKELDDVRKKYFSPFQVGYFSLLLSLINPIKENKYFQRLMYWYYELKASRSCNSKRKE